VLLPIDVVSPYSYQYLVEAPFGVTLPVTIAVEFDTVILESPETIGNPAEGVGDEEGGGLEPASFEVVATKGVSIAGSAPL
jgi:hypothetical protein